jgi:hypothetical protein
MMSFMATHSGTLFTTSRRFFLIFYATFHAFKPTTEEKAKDYIRNGAQKISGRFGLSFLFSTLSLLHSQSSVRVQWCAAPSFHLVARLVQLSSSSYSTTG